MKAYVAFFHGDIRDLEPVVGSTLEECLLNIQDKYGIGKPTDEQYPYVIKDEYGVVERVASEEEAIKISKDTEALSWEHDGLVTYYTPDPEDDKIEVWEIDTETKEAKIVWGFWGFHWDIPHNLLQGIMPGHKKSLYDLAMDEY